MRNRLRLALTSASQKLTPSEQHEFEKLAMERDRYKELTLEIFEEIKHVTVFIGGDEKAIRKWQGRLLTGL